MVSLILGHCETHYKMIKVNEYASFSFEGIKFWKTSFRVVKLSLNEILIL